MHEGGVTLFLVAVAVIGLAPVALVVVYLARKASEARRGDEQAPEDVERQRVLRTLAIGLGGVAVLAAVIAWYLGSSTPAVPAREATGSMPGMAMDASAAAARMLPPTLAGMPVSVDLTGTQAEQQVAKLHDADFPMRAAEIGQYGGGRATVWMSEAPDATSAATQVERMAERIAGGGSPFDPPEPLPDVQGVWVTRGMGQVHYFFARGSGVWWLSADRHLARRALSEILEVAS